MVLLGIDFQDGFQNDTVALLIDGEQVFLKENITSLLLIGLAESFTTEVEVGTILVEISIETRDLTESLSLDVSTDTYLGVSIVNGQIEVSPPRDEPFGYG